MMNVLQMLFNSISKAARGPETLQPWVDELENQVSLNGKFTKVAVAYVPIHPPPAFWDYKCKKCRVWEEPSTCKWVEGEINSRGWCTIWVPPETYGRFTWPQELIKGDW